MQFARHFAPTAQIDAMRGLFFNGLSLDHTFPDAPGLRVGAIVGRAAGACHIGAAPAIASPTPKYSARSYFSADRERAQIAGKVVALERRTCKGSNRRRGRGRFADG